jgi:glycosyltransferase involved in cell wall biosynthesis
MQENLQKTASNEKIKILFFIHDLGQGGAEKVLVNLVNNMDRSKFDITVMSLFSGGVNEQFLKDDIHYKTVFQHMFRGNSHIMKLLSPKQLHRLFIKEKFDIEVAYLEGPSARVISGCPDSETKLVSWIHIQQTSASAAARSFRSETEALCCYNRFNRVIAVSEEVKRTFLSALPINAPMQVLYNTNESHQIVQQSQEAADTGLFSEREFKVVGVGKLLKNKGFDRLTRIIAKLKNEGYPVHLYILGIGPLQHDLEQFIAANNLEEQITLLGYQTNPYKYVSKCDLFVCASFAEGFSTAATEALIVGTPVCTVEVSGMKEMLGEQNEWGVVTENSEEALYQGIKDLLDHPDKLAYYKEKAIERGKSFSTEHTVHAVEEMLLGL